MNSQPKISITIPTRNEAASISESIRQFVPFLEKFDLEIIISDAGSTDGTAAIVQNFVEKLGQDFSQKQPARLRFVQPRGKQNIAIGRNFGAQAACGDLLFHTDADVRLPQPECFFATILEKFRDPRVAAATAPIRIYPTQATATDRFYHWLMNTTIRWSIPLGWCLAKGECQIVRRPAFEKIGGYDERLVAGEDCNLFFRLQKMGHVVFLPSVEVHHSPRRFRQFGYWKVSYQYFMEGVWRTFLGRSFSREWAVVR